MRREWRWACLQRPRSTWGCFLCRARAILNAFLHSRGKWAGGSMAKAAHGGGGGRKEDSKYKAVSVAIQRFRLAHLRWFPEPWLPRFGAPRPTPAPPPPSGGSAWRKLQTRTAAAACLSGPWRSSLEVKDVRLVRNPIRSVNQKSCSRYLRLSGSSKPPCRSESAPGPE